jgi:hypothetical protein
VENLTFTYPSHTTKGCVPLSSDVIVITLGVIIGVTGVLAICAHLADAARLALYVPEDEDDEDIY